MKRLGTALIAGLGATLLVGAGSADTSPQTQKGLVFWNTLSSAYAVKHSMAGPNLAMFNCRDRRMPHFGPRCSFDIRGKLAFVNGPGGVLRPRSAAVRTSPKRGSTRRFCAGRS